METTIATTDSAQVLDCTPFSNQEREMAAALSCYWPSFYRHAFRYLGNVADAEDAVQDALLSAYKRVRQFKGEARMSTWLTAIVINSARMQLRRRPRQTHVSLDEHPDPESYAVSELLPDHRPSPAEQCLRSDLAENVLQLTRQLSPTLRRAFQLRHVDGLTIREMTDILGVAEGTVKARIARARAKLRSLMRKRVDKQVVINIV
jgi:RNA polymerase sigma-70 factor, ECF subfamily